MEPFNRTTWHMCKLRLKGFARIMVDVWLSLLWSWPGVDDDDGGDDGGDGGADKLA